MKLIKTEMSIYNMLLKKWSGEEKIEYIYVYANIYICIYVGDLSGGLVWDSMLPMQGA